VRWIIATLWFLARVLLITWATLAIYFSNLPWSEFRLAGAATFALFGTVALFLSRTRVMQAGFFAAFVAITVWWISIAPSHNREWRPDAARLSRAGIDGDVARITNVRNFEYRSRNDFTPRYEDREVKLSSIRGLDFYISYWREGLVGHTFLSFTFDDAPPLGISIETRPEIHEGFAPVASLFKQFELIYIVGEERDLVGVRANQRGEAVYLYHLDTSPEDARRLFLVYLDRINEIADHAEWYNLVSNNCTLNIIRYANAIGRKGRFDIRHLFNGLFDSYLYHSGRVNTDLPFEELRRRSHINEAARRAESAADFSAEIRKGLPLP
jgi:hypothetical protein